ncbi:MAG TPA: hypothetical protein VGE36_19750 [Roseateles sp.]
MSDHPTTSTPDTPAVSAGALASARRRRFIKGGAGLIPVALTLNSRPVLATTNSNGQCFSASAWGSLQGLAVSNSQYTRLVNGSRSTTVSCYSKSAWCKTEIKRINSKDVTFVTCDGWTTNKISCSDKKLDTIKNYTVGQVCGNQNGTAGIYGDVKCWDVVKSGTTYSPEQQAVIVAWLNCQITTITNTETCVLDTYLKNQLTSLGSCVPNGGIGPDGKTWTKTAVFNYLQNCKIGSVS